MRHEAPNQFHAAPERAARAKTAATVAKDLLNRFQPADQARLDALRHDDDPHAIASQFREQVEIARATECAKIRTDVLSVVAQNTEACGALVVTVHPEDAADVIDETRTGLDRIEIEREREATLSIGKWRYAKTVFDGWCDKSGGQLRHAPFSTWAMTCLVLAAAGLGELWGTAQLLDGQAIEGAPSPYTLGFLFASTSLTWGIIGACGTSLAADKRLARRALGGVLVCAALVLWAATALLAAHLRGCIEDGGSGTVAEIVASLSRGLLRPLASPLSLILTAASALATATAWLKWLGHIGVPFGHRGQDKERRWSEDRLHETEESHRTAIRASVALRVARLDGFSEQAWRPANDGQRLEREVGIALVEARECFKSVERMTRAMIVTYGATFRRLRPGVDVSAALELEPLLPETLGDPHTLHERVEMLAAAATAVAHAVAAAKAELRRIEVAFIRRVEAQYGTTRRSRPAQAVLAPVTP
jgi:hypothetical protein